MRENFDYVSMDNYNKDMTELSGQAAVVIRGQKDRIARLEQFIWAMAVAAGGRISIPDSLMQQRQKPGQLTMWRCYADRTLRIEARES